ncbi:MAG: hypothetical protein RLZZ455_579 [Candidatus Parcubacteria bacterium]
MFFPSHKGKAVSAFLLSSHARFLKSIFVLLHHFSIFDLLFILTVSLLPTQLGKHFWPDFSYVAGIRVDYLSPTLYLTDVLLLLLFIVYSRDVYRRRKNLDPQRLWRLVRRNIPILIGITAVIVGIIASPTPLLSGVIALRVGEIVFFALCTKKFVERAIQNAQLLLVALLGSVLFESVLAILQFVRQGSLGGAWYFLGERAMLPTTPGASLASLHGVLYLRAYGTFSHPNVLAGFILVSASLVVALIKNVHARNRVLIYRLAPLSLFVFLALVFTLSRTVLAFLVVMLISAVIVYRQRLRFLLKSEMAKSKKISITLLVISTIIIAVLVFPLIISRYIAPDFLGESFVERVILANAAVQLLLSHPLYGVGLGQFIPSLPKVIQVVTHSMLQPVHSVFLLVLSETGLAGFIGMTAVIYKGVRFQINQKKYLYLLPIIVCLLLGIGDHYLLTQQQGRMFLAISLGILFVRTKSFGHRSTKNTKKD